MDILVYCCVIDDYYYGIYKVLRFSEQQPILLALLALLTARCLLRFTMLSMHSMLSCFQCLSIPSFPEQPRANVGTKAYSGYFAVIMVSFERTL